MTNLLQKILPYILWSAKKMPAAKKSVGPLTKENIEKDAFNLARQKIIAHEGYRRDVYKDSLGYLTVGIGHKVLPTDNLVYGQVISDSRVSALFSADFTAAFNAAKKQAETVGIYTAPFIAGLASVNYQLGTFWTSKFPNTWDAIKKGNIATAISSLKNSAWYKQTPKRVEDFIATLKGAF